MANKTQPTSIEPTEFIDGLPKPAQRDDGRALLTLMGEVTGAPAVMWGASVIGYGSYHYQGRSSSGEWFRLGFSPRASQVVLYGGNPEALGDVLDRLGPHTTGKGCIYLKRVGDADPAVLRELIERIWSDTPLSAKD